MPGLPMTPEQERDRYKLALEEILVSCVGTLAYNLAERALDLAEDYPFDGANPADYLGIHPSNDPRLRNT